MAAERKAHRYDDDDESESENAARGRVRQQHYRPSEFRATPWVRRPPEALFKEVELLRRRRIPSARLAAFYVQRAKDLVFWSNWVEEAGLPHQETAQLLAPVLGCARVEGKDAQKQFPASSSSAVAPAVDEVRQHGEAFAFLCQAHLESRLTVPLLLQAHRILMRGAVHPDGRPVRAGEFRTRPAVAGYHTFLPHAVVPRAVAAMIDRYYERLEEGGRAEAGSIVALATWLMYEFLSIHPFEDGNGRLSRLLLNWALMSESSGGGHPFPIAMGYGVHRQATQHFRYGIRKARDTGSHTILSTIVLEAVWHGYCTLLGLPTAASPPPSSPD